MLWIYGGGRKQFSMFGAYVMRNVAFYGCVEYILMLSP